MWIKRIIAYGLVATVATAFVYSYFTGLNATPAVMRQSCAELSPEDVGTPAPNFTLTDLNGKKQSITDLRGKTVLLHFWATWCPPCLDELPSLYRLQGAITDDRFQLVTVSVDDNARAVQEFFAANSLPPLPVLMDPAQEIPHHYGTEKYPESYLIDSKGIVRYRFVNRRDWGSPEATACIRSVLAGKGSGS